MADLGVSYSSLSHASSVLNTMFDELTTQAQTLDSRAGAYLGTGWQGQAATSFQHGYQEWQAGSREVLASLLQMAALVDQANQRFAGTDQGVSGSMAALHARLGGSGSA